MSFNVWIETDGCGAMPTTLLDSQELLPVTVTNTLPNVAHVPADGLFMLIINGSTFTPVDGSFSVSGQSITWLSPIFDVDPTSTVVAVYSYMG